MHFLNNLEQKKKNNYPSFNQWSQLFTILNGKEKIAFFLLLLIFVASATYSSSNYYYKNTELVPANTGTFRYGAIGQPQFINPLYAQSSEIDKMLLELIFSGLMKYDENGHPIPDLIEEYQFTEDNKIFEFSLKNNIKWHDGKPLTIDDVIFTIKLIQDPTYLSPLYSNWANIEIGKTADNKGFIKMAQPYNNLLDNLTNLKIMPKHIWEEMTVQLILKNNNLNITSPIGSGPFKIDKVIQNSDGNKIRTILLKRNNDYYSQKPYIEAFQVFFLVEKKNDEGQPSGIAKKQIIELLNAGSLDGAIINNTEQYNTSEKVEKYNIKNPDYFLLSFNTQNKLLSDKDIRKALSLAINKEEVIEKAIHNQGYIINSPILSEFYQDLETEHQYNTSEAITILEQKDYFLQEGVRTKTIKTTSGFELKSNLKKGDNNAEVKKLQECLAKDEEIYPNGETNGNFGQKTEEAVIAFQEKYADEILTPAGLNKGTGRVMSSTLTKINELCFSDTQEKTPFTFTIKTLKNDKLQLTANIIKEQLEQIGIQSSIEALDENDIRKSIINKDYDAILVGQRLLSFPDLLPYWHSSQIFDPGWNLSLIQDKNLDKALERLRKINQTEQEEISKLFTEVEKTISDNYPAVFLYSIDYQYLMNKKLKGFNTKKAIDTTKTFNDIQNWYIKEKRIWK